VSQVPPNPGSKLRPRLTLVAAGLLLIALALVVIYTNRGAFQSPLALVVVAAIGVAALLLQLRLRPDLPSSMRGPLWLNGLGVLFAVAAVCADLLHFNQNLMLIAALGAVLSFAVSGIIVLSALRRRN
jgi:peptidoglycan/LPS O-acetylase OafA/YrhL